MIQETVGVDLKEQGNIPYGMYLSGVHIIFVPQEFAERSSTGSSDEMKRKMTLAEPILLALSTASSDPDTTRVGFAIEQGRPVGQELWPGMVYWAHDLSPFYQERRY